MKDSIQFFILMVVLELEGLLVVVLMSAVHSYFSNLEIIDFLTIFIPIIIIPILFMLIEPTDKCIEKLLRKVA